MAPGTRRARRGRKGLGLLAGIILLAAGVGAWLIDLGVRALQPRPAPQALPYLVGGRPPFFVSLPEGQPAPPLRAPALSCDGEFDLSLHKGSRPVVLVFGSFS
jgi:hypothetical protein